MVPSPLCTFVAHIIFLHVFFLSPFLSLSRSLSLSLTPSPSLSLSPSPSLSLSLQPFTDYLLRLPSSELLEKHLFRSRANRRLVFKPFNLCSLKPFETCVLISFMSFTSFCLRPTDPTLSAGQGPRGFQSGLFNVAWNGLGPTWIDLDR